MENEMWLKKKKENSAFIQESKYKEFQGLVHPGLGSDPLPRPQLDNPSTTSLSPGFQERSEREHLELEGF